jgi:hypothetical protein
VAALVYQVNVLRQSAAKAGTFFHADVTSNATAGDPMVRDGSGLTATSAAVTLPANAVDLPSSILLANALQALLATHAADAISSHASAAGAHLIPDTVNAPALAAVPVAVDQGTTDTLANAEKTFLNAHFTQAGVHVTNDAVNTIAAAAATTLPTGITLLNAMRAACVAHFASAPAGDSILLTSP